MPQGPRLVTQYLENISREALEQYPELLREFVSGRTGIYALFNKGDLYYAGLATSLRGRLRHHLRDRHRDSWDTFSAYLTIGDKNLRELESLLIRVIRPPGNRQMGRFEGAENLERKFENALDNHHRLTKSRLMRRPLSETDVPDDRKRSMRIHGHLRGKLVKANLRPDGTVKYKKKIYSSLSAAATDICRYSINGRWFWRFERSPGDWVRFPKK